MKKMKTAASVAAIAAAAGSIVLLGGGAASAYTAPGSSTPSWIGQDQNAIGGIAFFDASGNRVYSGPLDSGPFAAYAVGLATPRAGDAKATLYAYVPTPGVNPFSWNNEQIGLSTTYPNASAPAPINGTTLPVNTGYPTDNSLTTIMSDFPQTSTVAGYQNVYEIRLITSGGTNGGAGLLYDYADIVVDPTTNTWSELYSPDLSGTAVNSTLKVNNSTGPVSVNQGDTVNLTDTLDKTTATGTVQFKDNGTAIGSPVAVSGGTATATAVLASSGAHNITAEFTPAALSPFNASTSGTVVVNAAHVISTTSVILDAPTPAAPAAGDAVTLTAHASPSIAGVVKFFDSGALIGQGTVSGGVASLTTASLGQGTHHLTAQFVPTDQADYSNSPVSGEQVLDVSASANPQDKSSVVADVAAGSLAITTPYSDSNPLNLGTLALTADGQKLTASAAFGDNNVVNSDGSVKTGAAGDAQNPKTGQVGATPPAGSIQVVDTRAGNNGWDVTALSSGLTGPSDTINGENLGLTNLALATVPGNALPGAAGNVTTQDQAAAAAVAPGDLGQLGLGGTTGHTIASAVHGDGTIGIYGTLTVNAPTSTKAGHYAGTITFTVIGH